ncbi:MAG: hypothetical protein GWO20_09640, partial [Candidatus Korarchaeota archaeon]|nr:hypothetical protein [Candidatus Korarchaeota archaeon]NIU83718.1 hypothetical protein [Candidatus Thorarchaeota archaeon]NIW13920.1 hypothetical protein [Candidatus Thorarchaeota archaeon]NIW52036.1 hypothetical protein [Candidatus Korarchaeota archaeon]
LGISLVHHMGDPAPLRTFIHHTRLKTVITAMTVYLRYLLTDRNHKASSIQSTLETTVDELGTRLEGPLRGEKKPDLANIVREAFYLLGKRFGVTWKR